MSKFIANDSLHKFNFTSVLNILTFNVVAVYCLSITAVILNVFVIFTLLKRNIVTNALNVLILNLSLSDLLKSSTVIVNIGQSISFAGNTTMPKSTYTFWNIICKLNYFILLSANFSGILTLNALAVERFRAIYYPLGTRSDHKRYSVVIVFIWILSLGVSSYTVVSYHIIPVHPYFCLLNGEYYLGNNIWTIFTGLLCCILPVIITCLCYILIAVKICSRKSVIDSSMVHSQFLQKRRREIISIISLIAITILSTISNCAYYLYLIVALVYHGNRSFQSMDYYINANVHDVSILQASIFLNVAQSSIDPILYNFVSSNFRKSVKNCFSSHLRK